MRKITVKFLLCLLCASMLLGCFACNGNQGGEQDTTQQGTQESDPRQNGNSGGYGWPW